MRLRMLVPLLATIVGRPVAYGDPITLGLESRPRRPDAIADLRTFQGASAVGATWRYHDAVVVQAEHRRPGPDLKPTGALDSTADIQPRAGEVAFDDSAWEVIAPDSLETRRSGGLLSFGWYRVTLELPVALASLPVAGATVVFELVVDDYAEVWVDGRLPLSLGSAGGQTVAGWNAPNRMILTRDARPGQHIQLAIFAANAPLSSPPENYVWIRSATLDFYAPGRLPVGEEVPLTVERLDAALDSIVPPRARLERIASGFSFTEGPVALPDGALLFSDPNDNSIYRWTESGGAALFRVKSGYSGLDIGAYHQPGSNGLALDGDGRLTICEHGNRRVTRLEKNGLITVLADRYEGKRLNSPNDVAYRSDGALFFTDPPFGLPRLYDDPGRELQPAVYCLKDGRLSQICVELAGPNGIGLSPDERFLYVTDWDPARKAVLRYELHADGSLGAGVTVVNLGDVEGEEALDGLEVDERGNLYISGPRGLWIVAPDGRRLGCLRGPELAANFAWGGDDGQTLYWAARSSVYRLRLLSRGVARWPPRAPQ